MRINPTQNCNNIGCKGTFLNNPELQNYMKKASTVELSKFKDILERMNKVDDNLVYFFRETTRKNSLTQKQDELEITCFSKDKSGSPVRIMNFMPKFGYSDVIGIINKQFAELYPETMRGDKDELVSGISRLLLTA